MAKRKQFGNILDVSLTDPFTLKITLEDQKVAALAHEQELTEREQALFEHYGINFPSAEIPKEARDIIRKMAQDLRIQGFSFQEEIKKSGRPCKWTYTEGALLLLRVQITRMENPSLSIRSAISIIKNKYNYKYSVNTLYVRHKEAQKTENVHGIVKFYNMHKKLNNLDNAEFLRFVEEDILQGW